MISRKKFRLIEKTICKECGIVFKKADSCPRCGKGETIEVYFETLD
ncbi:MAG: hypothetical protein QW625_03165 [Candidatus Nanoarchaeia archaeon]